MANIAIKNIPDALYLAIKKRAKNNNRSINKEIIHTLESLVPAGNRAIAEILIEAEKLRGKSKIWATEKDLRLAKDYGRL